MRLPTRKSAWPWCEPSTAPGIESAILRKPPGDIAASLRRASHRLLRCRLQQFLDLPGVEFRVAGGEMPARRGRGRDQIELAVPDPLHRSIRDAGFGWI